jgi:hypothetical protein
MNIYTYVEMDQMLVVHVHENDRYGETRDGLK